MVRETGDAVLPESEAALLQSDPDGERSEPYLPLLGMVTSGRPSLSFDDDINSHESPPEPISRSLRSQLYTSHFLSTWNSRLFEFGAVLFLASIHPGTLLPMSVYALVRSGAAIIFAQSIGAWIDAGDRLVVVRTSIFGQRVAVAASCAVFWVLEVGIVKGGLAYHLLFGTLVVLACIEKLCAVMNLISVERDWVGVPRDLLAETGRRRLLTWRIRSW